MKIVRMLTLVSISLAVLSTYPHDMQDVLHENQDSLSGQAPQGTKKYTLADIAIAIAYTSDQQEGNTEQGAKKEGFDEMSPELFSQWPAAVKVEVRAGDLIEGEETQGALRAFLGAWIAYTLTSKASRAITTTQTEKAKKSIKTFEEKNGVHVYCVPGNHDFYDSAYTIPEWIREQYGDLRYIVKLKKQDGTDLPLRIICCGAYTDHKTCQWLKHTFETI